MKYDFDSPVERVGTSCYKYDMRQEVFSRADVIPMWIADMDFEVPPCITDAIKNRAEHAVYGYDFRDDEFFVPTINWLSERGGWKVEKEWILYTPGVVAAFSFAEVAFTAEGEGVLIQPPVYHPFAGTIKENGRKVVNNPLKLVDGHYEIDFEDLDRKLSEAKVFLFCNPHNPSGRVFTREELMKIGELCIKHDVIILSDEIHSDIVYKPSKHIHIASLSPEIAARTVTFIAPSKTFNIAGLSASIAIIPNEDIRERFNREMSRYHVAGGTAFGNVAFKAAYENGEEWLEQLLEYLEGNLEFVKSFLRENIPSVKTYPTEGTYLLWLDFREWGMTSGELHNFLVYKAGLGLNDGIIFGEEGAGFARMNVATQRSVVQKALAQLAAAHKENF